MDRGAWWAAVHGDHKELDSTFTFSEDEMEPEDIFNTEAAGPAGELNLEKTGKDSRMKDEFEFRVYASMS